MNPTYERSPDDAWHLRLQGLSADREAELIRVLGTVPGVSEVTRTDSDVRLAPVDGKVLFEAALVSAATSAGAAIETILLPPNARVTIHTMTAAGGG